MMINSDSVFSIARLSLQPGDILVVKTTLRTPDDARLVLEYFKKADVLPAGAKLVVVGQDTELSVLSYRQAQDLLIPWDGHSSPATGAWVQPTIAELEEILHSPDGDVKIVVNPDGSVSAV